MVRKQVKDGHPGSDGLSQSSRTSSSSSLTNGDCSSQEKLKQEDTTACNGSTSVSEQTNYILVEMDRGCAGGA